MTFALPEYDQAFSTFIYTTANALARAHHPLLAEMRTETTETGASSVVDSRESDQLHLPSESIGFQIAWDRADVVNGNFEALLLQLDSASGELGEKLMAMFVKTVTAVTDSTGNVVKAEGGEFTFETFYEALDQMEWSLDENDELVMPSLVMHPETIKKLPTEQTPEQKTAMDDLKRRKREELLAQRRRRRLS